MTDKALLLARLRGLLGKATSLGYTRTSAANDIYEGFAWSAVLLVGKAEGWRTAYANAGPGKTSLLFRKGPGNIYSQTPYSYLELYKDGVELEAHIGIKISGISGVSHEFDVCLLYKTAADDARAQRQDPDASGVVMHVECKFFTKDLSLGTARQLIGLTRDCPGVQGRLVSRGGASPAVAKLITHHSDAYVPDCFPHRAGSTALELLIQTALRSA